MQRYQFTGHLNPLPPGVKPRVQISGEVYLPAEVDARIAELEKALTEARDYALYRRNHSSIARAILQLIRPALGKSGDGVSL